MCRADIRPDAVPLRHARRAVRQTDQRRRDDLVRADRDDSVRTRRPSEHGGDRVTDLSRDVSCTVRLRHANEETMNARLPAIALALALAFATPLLAQPP